MRERIAVSNQHHPEFQLVESHYSALLEQIEAQSLALPRIQGEMIDGEVSKIHRSIYSTRYDHKQYNDKLETRLIYQLEPLAHFWQPHFQGTLEEARFTGQYLNCCLQSCSIRQQLCNSDNNQMILQRCFSKRMNLSIGLMLDSSSANLPISNRQQSKLYCSILVNTLPYPRSPVMTVFHAK